MGKEDIVKEEGLDGMGRELRMDKEDWVKEERVGWDGKGIKDGLGG